jgi:hypothetical protein
VSEAPGYTISGTPLQFVLSKDVQEISKALPATWQA